MHSAFVKINGVPTKVTCWGKWIEETFTADDCKDIVLLITGNPGVTSYYYDFLEHIHRQTGYNVWTLCHAGHELPEETTRMRIPCLKSNGELYGLQGQIDHKMEFIRKYVPSDCRIHLLGHSIGAYMCMATLRDEALNQLVHKAYFLFPTIEHMATTPNGIFYTTLVSRLRLFLLLLAYIFTWLPLCLQRCLVRLGLYFHDADAAFVAATLQYLQVDVLRHVLYLADDEMAEVRTRDDTVLALNKAKIIAMYATADGWAPTAMCESLHRDIPGIHAEILDKKFQHAFVLRQSIAMANVMVKRLKGD